jgi:hypothetical protein
MSRRSPGHGSGRGAPRRRGVTLIELVLYVTISFSVIGFTLRVIEQENARQSRELAAADLANVIEASQLYVARNYDALRAELFDKGGGIGSSELFQYMTLTATYTDSALDSLRDSGLLPFTFGDSGGANLGTDYRQEYRLLLRAVRRGDTTTPQPTLTVGDVWTGSPPAEIRPDLLDGVFEVDPGTGAVTNDEIDLEVLLITINDPDAPDTDPGAGDSRSVPIAEANRIVVQSGAAAAGILDMDSTGTLKALGPYGGWSYDFKEMKDSLVTASFDLDPTVNTMPDEGNFAALIALSRYGVLSNGDGPRSIAGRSRLGRCADVPRGTQAYAECVMGDAVYSEIVFNAWDSDGDGVVDSFPGFENVFSISMTDPALSEFEGSDVPLSRIDGVTFLGMGPAFASVTDGAIDIFPEIRGVSQIVMATTDGGPVPELRNVYGLSCAAGGSSALQDGRLTVDCEETHLPGAMTVSVSDGLAVQGAMQVTGGVTIVSDTPSLTFAGGNGGGISMTGDTIEVSDGVGGLTRLDPIVVSAGRLDVGELEGGALLLDLGSGEVDVTENALAEPAAVTVAATGGSISFAGKGPATCPAGWSRTVALTGIEPPPGFTRQIGGDFFGYDIDYDRVIGAEVQSAAPNDVRIDVTFARDLLQEDWDEESCITVCTVWFGGCVVEKDTCTYGPTDFDVDTHTVTNPAGLTVKAMVSCEAP